MVTPGHDKSWSVWRNWSFHKLQFVHRSSGGNNCIDFKWLPSSNFHYISYGTNHPHFTFLMIVVGFSGIYVSTLTTVRSCLFFISCYRNVMYDPTQIAFIEYWFIWCIHMADQHIIFCPYRFYPSLCRNYINFCLMLREDSSLGWEYLACASVNEQYHELYINSETFDYPKSGELA